MSQHRRPLIAGNWKMNGLRESAMQLARAVADGAEAGRGAGADLLVCPPASLVVTLSEMLAGTRVTVGGQDCYPEESGAHTGDVSAEMLADAGASYVIVGHSERRTDHGETDEVVRAKAEAAHRAGLCAIVCIGETEAERNAGGTLEVVEGQLNAGQPADADATNTVIAYEPVWAIGTGRTPTVAQVSEIHEFLRNALAAIRPHLQAMRIIYGGSMKPDNARELLAVRDVDGGLIGGASLDAEDFLVIAESVP